MTPIIEQFIFIICPLAVGATLVAGLRLILVSSKETRFSCSLLVVLACVFAAQLWNRYVMVSPVDGRFALHWPPIILSFWLIGPLVYFFILRRISTVSTSYTDILHAIPFLFCSLYVYFNPIDTHLEQFVLLAAWNVVTLTYLVLSARLLLALKKRRDQSSSRSYDLSYFWGVTLVVGILLFVIADIVMSFFILSSLKIPAFALLGFELSRALVCLLLVLQFQFGEVTSNIIPGAEVPRNELDKERELRLEISTARQLAELLERKMTKELLFRQPDINLRNLSEHMGVGTHELSEVLNSFMKTNFYSYINRKRIEYAAMTLISEPNMAIVDVAINSGYNSKATFYSSFKKIIGSTPSQYRNVKREGVQHPAYD